MPSSLLLSKHRLKYLLSWALKIYALFFVYSCLLDSSKKLNSEREIWGEEDSSYIREIFRNKNDVL